MGFFKRKEDPQADAQVNQPFIFMDYGVRAESEYKAKKDGFFHAILAEMIKAAKKNKKCVVGGDKTFLHVVILPSIKSELLEKSIIPAKEFIANRIKEITKIEDPDIQFINVGEYYKEYADDKWLSKLDVEYEVVEGWLGILYVIEENSFQKWTAQIFSKSGVQLEINPVLFKKAGIAHVGSMQVGAMKSLLEMVANGYHLYSCVSKLMGIAHGVKALAEMGGTTTESESIEDLMKDAEKSLDEGQAIDAMRTYDLITNRDPNNKIAWFKKGLIAQLVDCPEEALMFYDRVLKIDPKAVDGWNNSAIVRIQLGRNDEALSNLDKILEIDPKNSKALMLKGDIFSGLEKFDEATRLYKASLDADSKNGNSLLGLGKISLKQGNEDHALHYFNKAMTVSPELAEAWGRTGILMGKRQQFEEALKYFERATELEPENPGYWHGRAMSLKNLGRKKEYKECLEKAEKLEAKDS